MLIKQKQITDKMKKSYSQVDYFAKGQSTTAKRTIPYILNEGYALMNAYHMNEIIKVIKTLKELNIEYTMRVVENPTQNAYEGSFYEFTTPYFLDDRK